MDPDSLIRISELIHAIKVFIAAANRLEDKDMEHLDKVAELLEKRSIIDEQIRNLEKKKEKI